MSDESMRYDVLIIGAGPAGLAAAIKIKQLAMQQARALSVGVLEKAAQVGGHILSGAVLDLKSLKALLPDDWHRAPFNTAVTNDKLYFLTKNRAVRLPVPALLSNHGNYLISLGELCQFLANVAESLGCDIYSGFAANKLLFDTCGCVEGVLTGAMGLDKQGKKTHNYQPGMPIFAKQTLFAEGCRGQLSQQLITHFKLQQAAAKQTYGLGIKEVWQVKTPFYRRGQVVHTLGWPLRQNVYGGSFIYHLNHHQIALGLVVALDYQNPWLDPFLEMQRFKTHPWIKKLLTHGERIAFGARALNEGGWQSIPKLTFPGGALIGDSAGFLNVARIKGIHTAMQSGMLAAKAVVDLCFTSEKPIEIVAYNKLLKQSWVNTELYQVRNIRPGFGYGLALGLVNAWFETYVTRGHSPWTLNHFIDHNRLKKANDSTMITYDKADNMLTFDKLSSIYLSNVHHSDNQPGHLILKNAALAIDINYRYFSSPETRYCPAGVYEIQFKNNQPYLQINAQNCIHCKTCDIKDPKQNILWQAPEGGGGPNYMAM